MKKHIVIAVVPTVFIALFLSCVNAPRTYSPTATRNLFDLVKNPSFDLDRVQAAINTAINNGADVNARDTGDYTPLLYAVCYNPWPKIITVLLDAGADVNAQDNEGITSLMLAATIRTPDLIRTLLKAGANVNAGSANGTTPLMFAAKFNHDPEVVSMLLKAGVDAKVKNKEGKTALDYAQGNDSLKDTDALKILEEASK